MFLLNFNSSSIGHDFCDSKWETVGYGMLQIIQTVHRKSFVSLQSQAGKGPWIWGYTLCCESEASTYMISPYLTILKSCNQPCNHHGIHGIHTSDMSWSLSHGSCCHPLGSEALAGLLQLCQGIDGTPSRGNRHHGHCGWLVLAEQWPLYFWGLGSPQQQP